jgi:dynein heavy chain
MVKNMFVKSKGDEKQKDNIQKAAFMDESVKKKLKEIKTGEDAISFFAKYGNTTPIKFIHCIRAPTPKEVFKPYQLSVLPRQEREPNLTNYYTISASGIVNV